MIPSSIHGAPVTYDEARFRWAVCQIDSLQRLKCERETIQKALKNLPKTLNETYDRIFLAVPEEERLFVEHALRWIAHHNELYDGRGIPLEIIIQATEASMLSLTGKPNERFYDKDTLREVCGCLIDMSPDGILPLHGDPYHPYISVSFAHYSVREYLDSTRTSNAVFGYDTIGGGDLKDCFLEITLSEARHIESNETISRDQRGIIFQAVNSKFSIYCLVSAFLSLQKFPSQICRHSTLIALAIDLLDPSMPHFSTMEAAGYYIEHVTDLDFMETIPLGSGILWDVGWHQNTNTELQHLYNLLVLTDVCGEFLPLAKTFLQGKDLKSLLQAQMCFWREEGPIFADEGSGGSYISTFKSTFKGSLIEVFAELALRSVTSFKLLVETGVGSFDPSIALLHYIGCHDHSNCEGFCPLQRLLELGADPNLRGYENTPLQIATFTADYEGVEMLLEAGAMPNDTGSADGVFWRDDSLMSDLGSLYGASPLRICRDFVAVTRSRMEGPGKYARQKKKIEALLLYHGAEAFSRDWYDT